jgi:secondary thiamine-phosphate synthase enzyme
MHIHQETISVRTRGRKAIDITQEVARVVQKSGVHTGLCTAFLQHTSAGLVIQENADPSVLEDLATWLSTVAPESGRWQHDTEGPDDMPAHLRTVLTRTSECIPICAGRLCLGTWQALYVWEHRATSHARRIVVHVTGLLAQSGQQQDDGG